MSEGAIPATEKQAEFVIRQPQDVQEMTVCVELQKQIWNYSDIETVPDQMFIVAKESGGQVLVAYHQERAIGFALSFAGTHQGSLHLHSHMVGIVPEYQDRGVGRLLKIAQRDDAMQRGIELIEWTFDPLQLKNAYFNLVRLGAIMRRYISNFYGRTSSPLHAGLPTDRLVAEWWLRSPRTQAALRESPLTTASQGVRVSIPKSIRKICASDAARAEKIQSQARTQFETHFAEGYAAVGFVFDDENGNYILELYED